MNILSNLKANFVSPLIPTMCPSQKMQFHHVASPIKNLLANNAVSTNNLCRKFTNPNFFNQNTYGENYPSNYKKITHFEVTQNDEIENPRNSSEMIAQAFEKTDFGTEIALGLPKSNCVTSRKRSRKSKDRSKIPEKHNSNRQVLNEMMDIDSSNDSTDVTLTEDREFENDQLKCLKLCDLLVLPEHSSPVSVSRIDIAIDTKIPAQTTCYAFSISPPISRQRQISTTESEDSFIVFDSGTDEECDFSEDAASEDDENSDLEECDDTDTDSPGSVIPTKKVRFADEKELCEIHPMVQWSFAYQAARKGPWEVYARDRERFKNRISFVGEKIAHCFEPEHRQKVYDQRFREEMVE